MSYINFHLCLAGVCVCVCLVQVCLRLVALCVCVYMCVCVCVCARLSVNSSSNAKTRISQERNSYSSFKICLKQMSLRWQNSCLWFPRSFCSLDSLTVWFGDLCVRSCHPYLSESLQQMKTSSSLQHPEPSAQPKTLSLRCLPRLPGLCQLGHSQVCFVSVRFYSRGFEEAWVFLDRDESTSY